MEDGEQDGTTKQVAPNQWQPCRECWERSPIRLRLEETSDTGINRTLKHQTVVFPQERVFRGPCLLAVSYADISLASLSSEVTLRPGEGKWRQADLASQPHTHTHTHVSEAG